MSQRTPPRLPYQDKYCSLLDALHMVYKSTSPNLSDPLDDFPGARALPDEHYNEEGAMQLSPEDALGYLLDAAIGRFGYSACDVFGAIFDYQAMTRRHESAFNIQYAELQAAVSALSRIQSTNPIFHQTFALCPVDQGFLVYWKVDFKSDWVARNVMRELSEAEGIAICQQIRSLQSIPSMVSAVMASRQFFKIGYFLTLYHISTIPKLIQYLIKYISKLNGHMKRPTSEIVKKLDVTPGCHSHVTCRAFGCADFKGTVVPTKAGHCRLG